MFGHQKVSICSDERNGEERNDWGSRWPWRPWLWREPWRWRPSGSPKTQDFGELLPRRDAKTLGGPRDLDAAPHRGCWVRDGGYASHLAATAPESGRHWECDQAVLR